MRNPPRILAVDDVPENLDIVRMRLQAHGYEVVTATDGKEALSRFGDNGDIDVILLDAMMPNMSGVEVLQEIRKSGSEIPVVIISAHLDAQEPSRMRKLGATDCVPKPFEWDDLIGKIEELAP